MMNGEHGLRGYWNGCVCETCRAANRDYRRRQRAKAAGLEPAPVPPDNPPEPGSTAPQPEAPVMVLPVAKPKAQAPPADEIGPVEAAVIAACAALPASAKMPDLVAAARVLAQDLDDSRRWSCHPSATRQLVAVMAKLREGSAGRQGKLASVAAMSWRAPQESAG